MLQNHVQNQSFILKRPQATAIPSPSCNSCIAELHQPLMLFCADEGARGEQQFRDASERLGRVSTDSAQLQDFEDAEGPSELSQVMSPSTSTGVLN